MSFDVAASGLWKRFHTEEDDPVVALRNISLDVEPGQFYVLVGDSGSGKTTLLRCVAGLETPDEGDIELRGEMVFSSNGSVYVRTQERQIGMVFQSYAIWPHLTVYDNIALPLLHGRHRPPRSEVRKKVNEALEIVGLSDLGNRPAPNLSGGQQQRVALARAIAVSSKMLLMDEPMSNLDARLRHEVRTQIREVARHYGTTVLYVTHDQEEAMSLADQMALMRHGVILQRGTPEDLYDRSVSREVAEFFGPMNIIEGELAGDGQINTGLGSIEAPTNGLTEKAVVVGLRPEKVQLNPSDANGKNVFDAKIDDRVYLGGVKVYQVKAGDTNFRIDAPDNYNIGETVKIKLPMEAMRVFPATAKSFQEAGGTP